MRRDGATDVFVSFHFSYRQVIASLAVLERGLNLPHHDANVTGQLPDSAGDRGALGSAPSPFRACHQYQWMRFSLL